jgi:hypothetical protein
MNKFTVTGIRHIRHNDNKLNYTKEKGVLWNKKQTILTVAARFQYTTESVSVILLHVET